MPHVAEEARYYLRFSFLSPLRPAKAGTQAEDYLQAAVMVDRGTAVVVAGSTEGTFGESSGGDGQDFVAIKLDSSDGTETWRYQVPVYLQEQACAVL